MIQSQLEALRRDLHAHNHRYYVLAAPIVSDREFDELMEKLLAWEAKYPEWYWGVRLRRIGMRHFFKAVR